MGVGLSCFSKKLTPSQSMDEGEVGVINVEGVGVNNVITQNRQTREGVGVELFKH